MSVRGGDTCEHFRDPSVDVSNCSIAEAYGVSMEEIHSRAVFPYVAAIVSLALVVSTVGNGLILLILWTKSNMRNSVNIVIGNMAFADLFCCFVVSEIAIGRNLQHNYIMGETVCKYNPFLALVTMSVSDYSLVLLCYERLKLLWWPFLTGDSSRTTHLKCTLVWLFVASISCWQLFDYRKIVTRAWGGGFIEVSCQQAGDHYWEEIMAVVMSIYLPDAVTTILYVLLLCKLRTVVNVAADDAEREAVQRLNKYNRSISLMIAVNLVVSWISFFPEQYLFLDPRNNFSQRWSYRMEDWYLAYHVLMAIRCMVNPLIYGYANKSFRREVRRLLPFVSRSSHALDAPPPPQPA